MASLHVAHRNHRKLFGNVHWGMDEYRPPADTSPMGRCIAARPCSVHPGRIQSLFAVTTKIQELEIYSGFAAGYGRDSHWLLVGPTLEGKGRSRMLKLWALVRSAVRNLFRNRQIENQLDDEVAYYFTWQTQILDGVAGAWHTADLQFCFDNTKRYEQGTGNTPAAQALAKKMASAWAAFAATGNPSIRGLNWAPTDPDTNRAMIWDNECRMADGSGGGSSQDHLDLTVAATSRQGRAFAGHGGSSPLRAPENQ